MYDRVQSEVLQNHAAERRLRRSTAEEDGASGDASASGEDVDLRLPTMEEESILIDCHARRVFEDLAKPFNLPSHLRATASAYLRRFYLTASPLQSEVRQVAVTCLWLSTKTCEWHIPLDTFGTKLGLDKEYVLEREFEVANGIEFDFVHWSAYRPLYGFHLDISAHQGVKANGKANGDSDGAMDAAIGQVHDKAKALVNSAVVTDLPLLHSPSIIALAALAKVDRGLVERYCKDKSLDVMPKLDAVDFDGATQGDKVDDARIEEIEAIVKAAFDPATRPDSLLYRQRQGVKELEESDRRRMKHEQTRAHNDALGSVLA